MSEPRQNEENLLTSAKRILRSGSHLVESRVELFLLELQEERVRVGVALLLLLAGSIFALMALVMATFTILVAFWDSHRIAVLVALTIAYTAGAVSAALSLRRRLHRWQAFSASLEQIRKDWECFETKN